jgi:Tol biopolymer transport system component
MAYAIATQGADPRIVTMTLDLSTGVATEAAVGAGDAAFNPAWRPDGDLTVASLDASGGGDAISVDAIGDGATVRITNDARTIELPLTWSPDGSALAVLAIDADSALDAAGSHVEIVTLDGERERVSDQSDVLIVGWME